MKKKARKLEYPTELPYWKGIYFIPDNKGVQKIGSWYDEGQTKNTFQFLNYLKNNRHPSIVTILNCQSSAENSYSYEMPLMANLLESEKDLISLLSESEEYASLKRQYRYKIYRLKKKHPKLFHFLKRVMSWGVYNDLHSDNVMKDQYGNYKLIDIEGFSFYSYSVNDIIKAITSKH
jgi:hypothetical protein